MSLAVVGTSHVNMLNSIMSANVSELVLDIKWVPWAPSPRGKDAGT